MRLLALPGSPSARLRGQRSSALLSASLLTTPPSPLALLQIYTDPTKRLELYFRPKDPYCHPVCANRFSTSSMLLRIKKRTRRRRGALGAETDPLVTYDLEILGIISTIYKFQGNCDICRGIGWFRGLMWSHMKSGVGYTHA